jgi:glycosyltransferase involved in cell wall biosynthesis/Tfp pilus assembly protein PilF
VFGNLPTVEEIDQFRLLAGEYDITVISSESVCGYLTQTSYFQDLRCISLPDHDDNPSYLPGLEKVLSEFDVVVVKERLGMYAFQTVKAKWKNRFRLAFWVDNATPFPGEDIDQMRTIREEVNNAADAFIVQTDVVRQALRLEGVEDQRIMTFNPWVETRVKRTAKLRAKAVETLGLSDTDFVISHFGQIEWEEGLFDLVHAVEMITESDASLAERIKLVFCGIGSFSSELRDRLVTLGLDRQAVYVAPSREAFDTIVAASDAMYVANNPSRDRIEGEPYRILTAMANKIPVIAARTPLIEELCGKHRIDFCPNSPVSLANAIKKCSTANALRNNIVAKNAATVKECMSKSKVTKEMSDVFGRIARKTPTVDVNALDHQVMEVETLVRNKQYLDAIDVIETIFRLKEIPVHHHANLLRLIGDCFCKLGDNDSAKDSYSRSAEMDPYSAKAFIGLGTVCLTSNGYDRAVLHFQKAITLAPEDEMANLGLGLAFQGLGELEEANRWVIKSLGCNPENQAALYTLVQIGQSRENYADTEKAISKYCQLHPHDHNMLFTLSAIQHKLGNNTDALTNINTIIEVDPQDEKAILLAKEIRRASSTAAETSNG